MVQGFAAEMQTKDAHDLGMHIAKHTGLVHTLYQDKTPEGVARYDNLQELLNGMKAFTDQSKASNPDDVPTLGEFLMDVALLTDADQDDGDDNKVGFMSIHAAKGLEFAHVFVVGMEENLFPSQMAMESRADMEEERRLFYVAITRAEKSCTLSYALTRYKWGQLIQAESSRFLEEIDPECVIMPSAQAAKPNPFAGGAGMEAARNTWQSMSSGKNQPQSAFERLSKKAQPQNTASPFKGASAPVIPKSAAGKPLKRMEGSPSPERQATAQAASSSDLQEGTQVHHERFGKGKITRIEGEAPNQKATVFFPSAGQKQLLLKFAKLQVVS